MKSLLEVLVEYVELVNRVTVRIIKIGILVENARNLGLWPCQLKSHGLATHIDIS